MSVTKGNHVRFVDEHMENYDQEVWNHLLFHFICVHIHYLIL